MSGRYWDSASAPEQEQAERKELEVVGVGSPGLVVFGRALVLLELLSHGPEEIVLRRNANYVRSADTETGSAGCPMSFALRNTFIAVAISVACVSIAKCPVSRSSTFACGKSFRNASAPAGMKNGSFLPQMASRGGLHLRKYS